MKRDKKTRQLFQDKATREKQNHLQEGLQNGSIREVDPTKIISRSCMPKAPEYYYDKPFKCKDCGSKEVWTARKQKQWYEVDGGEIESAAIRCRKCRRIENERKSEARRVHLEGIKKKKEL